MSWLNNEGFEEFIPFYDAYSIKQGYTKPLDDEPTRFDLALSRHNFGMHLSLDTIIPDFYAVPFAQARGRIWHFIDHLRKIIPELPDRSELLIDYSNSPDWQGLAGYGKNGEQICWVASGFCDAIFAATESLFACKDFLPNWYSYNEFTKEEVFKNLPSFFSKDRIASVKDGYLISGWLQPLSLQRLAASKIVAEIAIQFAFLHELSHVICGHLRYINNVGKDKALHMADILTINEDFSNVDEDIYKFLELDADAMALNMLLGFNLFRSTVHPLPDIKPTSTQEHRGRDFAHWAHGYSSGCLLTAGINIFLLLSCARTSSGNTYFNSNHPKPRERYLSIFIELLHIKDRVASFDSLAAYDAWGPTSNSLHQSWENLGLPGADLIKNINHSSNTLEEMKAIFSFKNRLANKVVPAINKLGEGRKIGDAVVLASQNIVNNLTLMTVERPKGANWSWLSGDAIF